MADTPTKIASAWDWWSARNENLPLSIDGPNGGIGKIATVKHSGKIIREFSPTQKSPFPLAGYADHLLKRLRLHYWLNISSDKLGAAGASVMLLSTTKRKGFKFSTELQHGKKTVWVGDTMWVFHHSELVERKGELADPELRGEVLGATKEVLGLCSANWHRDYERGDCSFDRSELVRVNANGKSFPAVIVSAPALMYGTPGCVLLQVIGYKPGHSEKDQEALWVPIETGDGKAPLMTIGVHLFQYVNNWRSTLQHWNPRLVLSQDQPDKWRLLEGRVEMILANP
jgi:hypothetical protein